MMMAWLPSYTWPFLHGYSTRYANRQLTSTRRCLRTLLSWKVEMRVGNGQGNCTRTCDVPSKILDYHGKLATALSSYNV